ADRTHPVGPQGVDAHVEAARTLDPDSQLVLGDERPFGAVGGKERAHVRVARQRAESEGEVSMAVHGRIPSRALCTGRGPGETRWNARRDQTGAAGRARLDP